MTSVDSNFNFLCGRPHGAGPPVHMRPPEPDPLPPPCGRHKWMAPIHINKPNNQIGGYSGHALNLVECNQYVRCICDCWVHWVSCLGLQMLILVTVKHQS